MILQKGALHFGSARSAIKACVDRIPAHSVMSRSIIFMTPSPTGTQSYSLQDTHSSSLTTVTLTVPPPRLNTPNSSSSARGFFIFS